MKKLSVKEVEEKSEKQFEEEKKLLHTPIGKEVYSMVVDQYGKNQWLWDLAVVVTKYMSHSLAQAREEERERIIKLLDNWNPIGKCPDCGYEDSEHEKCQNPECSSRRIIDVSTHPGAGSFISGGGRHLRPTRSEAIKLLASAKGDK